MQTVMAFIGGLGGWEILLILLVLLIFFGAKKIPDLARGLGRGIREFKDATNEIRDEIEMNDDKKRSNPSTTNRNVNEAPNEAPLNDEKPVTKTN